MQDTQRAADQSRIFQFPDPHRDVGAFADQIDTAVRDTEVEFDAWVAIQERAGPCRDQGAAKRRWHCDPEHAAHVTRHLHDVLGFLDGTQMGGHLLTVRGAFGSPAERARRPLQKAHAKTLFQSRDAFDTAEGLAAISQAAPAKDPAPTVRTKLSRSAVFSGDR